MLRVADQIIEERRVVVRRRLSSTHEEACETSANRSRRYGVGIAEILLPRGGPRY